MLHRGRSGTHFGGSFFGDGRGYFAEEGAHLVSRYYYSESIITEVLKETV